MNISATIPEINLNPTVTTTEVSAISYPEIDTTAMATEARKFFDTLEMDDDYTEKGIRYNLNDWAINKMPLIELLRKHPDWNEEAKAVILHSDINRNTNTEEAKIAVYSIYDASNMNSLDDMTWMKYRNTQNRIIRLIENGNLISEEMNSIIETLNEDYPDLHARVGQKTSRVINKLFGIMGFNNIPEYNRLYAKLSDAINPLTVKTTTILSVHWMDFLTMSRGNSWSSCHGIESNASYSGCYKAGCLSYANDNISLIFYTIDNAYDGNTPWKEKKITRQVFFYKDGVLVQERLYPQCNDNDNGRSANSQVRQYRTIVESIFAVCENRPNLWKKHEQVHIERNEDCFMYEDWNSFTNWKVCFNDIDEESTVRFYIGAPCYCLKCGEAKEDYYHDDDARTLMCGNCSNFKEECYNCGDMCDPDDMYTVDGHRYCSDCVFYCDYHNEWEVSGSEIYIRNYGYVCQDAFNSGEFEYCEHCGVYVCCDNENTEEVNTEDGVKMWCDRCIRNDAFKCADCGELFDYTMESFGIDDIFYCPDCIEDHMENDDDNCETDIDTVHSISA